MNAKVLPRPRPVVVALLVLGMWTVVAPVWGARAVQLALSNGWVVLEILPPLMILIAWLDVWIPQETVIRWMGPESGARGWGIALLLGTVAAGPLFLAFPIAAALARKGVRFAYIMAMLGAWSTTKLTALFFEWTELGPSFTAIHIGVSLSMTLAGAMLLERFIVRPHDLEHLSNADTS